MKVLHHPGTDMALSTGYVALAWLHHFIPALSGTPGLYLEHEPLSDEICRFIVEMHATDSTGTRYLHSESALVLPKGSAKSQIAAALAILQNMGPVKPAGLARGGEQLKHGRFTYTYAPGEPMAIPDPYGEVTILATTKEQAKRTCYTMVWRWLGGVESGASERLIDSYGIEPRMQTAKTAFTAGNGSQIAVIAAEHGEASADGGRQSLVIFDESHRMTGSVVETADALTANLKKRAGRALHSTTIYAIGEGSLLERLYGLADEIRAGRTPKLGVLIHHSIPTHDADLDTMNGIMDALGEVYAPAPWVDLVPIAEQFFDPREDIGRLKRLYLGIPHTPSTRWLDAETIERAAAAGAFIAAPADTIAIGLDASQGRSSTSDYLADVTAIVAAILPTEPDAPTRMTPLQTWVPRDASWTLDHDELDRAVRDAFETYRVVACYADPPYIEQLVARWERAYGRKLVAHASTRKNPIAYYTNRYVQMGVATAEYEQALQAGTAIISGDPDMVAHHRNAHRRATRSGYILGKERRDSNAKIDIAVASVLAYTASMDAIRAGALARRNARHAQTTRRRVVAANF